MKNKIILKNISGFTVVELIVAISVIAVLSAVIMGTITLQIAKSRDTRRKADIAEIKKALEMYYAANNRYPASGGAIAPNISWSNSADASWDNLAALLQPYIKKLPKDPSENNNTSEWANTGNHYTYLYCGPTYILVYQFEIAQGVDPGAYCGASFYQLGGTGANTKIKTNFK